ncbi:hypothetical protein [Jiangella alkaliphila]|uniref:hypothetical protein n=1 Tax=Jiangella alkaliphila TaxID=419479 RepID=UPI00128E23D1|nr:hypothetical protein [Jiangella alkaliphila]
MVEVMFAVPHCVSSLRWVGWITVALATATPPGKHSDPQAISPSDLIQWLDAGGRTVDAVVINVRSPRKRCGITVADTTVFSHRSRSDPTSLRRAGVRLLAFLGRDALAA